MSGGLHIYDNLISSTASTLSQIAANITNLPAELLPPRRVLMHLPLSSVIITSSILTYQALQERGDDLEYKLDGYIRIMIN